MLKDNIKYTVIRPGLYLTILKQQNKKILERITLLEGIRGSRSCLRFISINTGKILQSTLWC